jgi:hypothetical protein
MGAPDLTVSKRLRFEILRRDDHTCYYCGRKPPEVKLTIDHVLPQALGGDDAATNLVTCCEDCNSGKTSVAPGSPLIAQVSKDAARWSAAMQAAIAKASTDHEAVVKYRNEFYDAWHSYTQAAPMDEGWRSSVEHFRVRGLPIEVLTEAVHRTMGLSKIKPPVKFRYACGIAWKKIEEIDRAARSFVGAAAPTGAAADADEVLVDALTALWRANWLASGHGEPGAALAAEARESIADAYAENEEVEALVRGTLSASWGRSSDVKHDVYDDAPLGEYVLHSFLRGWIIQEPTPPGSDELVLLAGWTGYAEAAGYSQDGIAEGAYWAARNGSAGRLPGALKSAFDIANAVEGDDRRSQDFAEVASWHQVDPKRVAEMWEHAQVAQADLARELAERKIRGGTPGPWGA